jgi:glycosyltransferase involved in cell wall biosynthesis
MGCFFVREVTLRVTSLTKKQPFYNPLPMLLPRLAILFDYPEEHWQSMDLCAQMLLQQLQAEYGEMFQCERVCPEFRWRLVRSLFQQQRIAYNGDRLLNRFWDYPRYLKQRVAEFDLFHIADHTYAHLVHELPAKRTGVFCHDIDAFRCLVEPKQEPRPKWFRAMSNRILQGLQKAAVVFYSTTVVRQQIEQYDLVNPARLIHAPYGIGAEFSISPEPSDPHIQQVLAQVGENPFILHVGSCIPRKRIDVLLDVFAALKTNDPDLRLVKVGGDWTQSQRRQISQLHLSEAIVHLQGLERRAIAALYRRATVVLLPSEAEGFGLPVIEALACGAIVVASDIPVLREVGGDAVVYCAIADVSTWATTIKQLLQCSANTPSPAQRFAQAQNYSWSNHTQIVVQAYQQLASSND